MTQVDYVRALILGSYFVDLYHLHLYYEKFGFGFFRFMTIHRFFTTISFIIIYNFVVTYFGFYFLEIIIFFKPLAFLVYFNTLPLELKKLFSVAELQIQF